MPGGDLPHRGDRQAVHRADEDGDRPTSDGGGILDKAYATGREYAKGFKQTRTIVFDDLLPKWDYRAFPQTGKQLANKS